MSVPLARDPFFSIPDWKPPKRPPSHILYQLPILTVLERWSLSIPTALEPLSRRHRARSTLLSDPSQWDHLAFTLAHDLAAGEERFSQVWLGSATSRLASQPCNEMPVVVVKLFIDGLFPRNDDDSVDFGGTYAEAEAIAYTKMKHLQGRPTSPII